MPSLIKRQGHRFIVVDGAGAPLSGPLPFEDAQAHLARQRTREITEHERRKNDPETMARRRTKAAYRTVERDPQLQLMKLILPREGELERSTQRIYERSLKRMEGLVSFASSDPHLHAELNKTSGQRRVTRAKQALDQKATGTRKQIAERWGALADVPDRKRASVVARELNIDVRHVRRLRPR